ncbi:MAG: hypothetical protein VW239_09435, partial [Candidatus Nanopelagicales bacterium]
AQEDMSDLAATGVTVYGDLADLAVSPEGSGDVPGAELVAAAAGAAAYLLSQRRGGQPSSEEDSGDED